MNTLIVGQELLDSFVDLGYVFFIHFIFDFFLVAGVFDELIENFNGFKADVFLHKVPIVELEEISQIFFLCLIILCIHFTQFFLFSFLSEDMM